MKARLVCARTAAHFVFYEEAIPFQFIPDARRRMFKQSAGLAAMTLAAMVMPLDLRQALAQQVVPAKPAPGWRIWLTHQSNDPSSIVISWQTDLPGNSVVYYGVAN
ncbi:MAG: hypothetical protein ABSF34_21480, partial [Verrucomicrobiota bacterium]